MLLAAKTREVYWTSTHLLYVDWFGEGLEASVQRQALVDVTQEEAKLSQHVLLLLLQTDTLLLRQLMRGRQRSQGKDLQGLRHWEVEEVIYIVVIFWFLFVCQRFFSVHTCFFVAGWCLSRLVQNELLKEVCPLLLSGNTDGVHLPVLLPKQRLNLTTG